MFGIVYSSGKTTGPVAVNSRGYGEGPDGFMVVPAPKSDLFPEVDFDIDGVRGYIDREYGFWSVYAPTIESAMSLIEHINKNGSPL